MACARGWSISQMDVKTAFINADIDNQDIYFDLPGGYKQHREINGQRMCLKAKRALYAVRPPTVPTAAAVRGAARGRRLAVFAYRR